MQPDLFANNGKTCSCGAALTHLSAAVEETTMGYLPGFASTCRRVHDDNCMRRGARCGNGHWSTVALRRRCDHCGWKGKEFCECHDGAKLDEWPDLPVFRKAEPA